MRLGRDDRTRRPERARSSQVNGVCVGWYCTTQQTQVTRAVRPYPTSRPSTIRVDLLSSLSDAELDRTLGIFTPDGLTYGPWTSRGREIPVTDKRVKHRSGQACFSTPFMEGCEVAEVD